MQTIISAVEELISNKKSQIRYHKEEIDRIFRQMDKEQKEVECLEMELGALRRGQSPTPNIGIAR